LLTVEPTEGNKTITKNSNSLSDFSQSGNPLPWRDRKLQSLAVAETSLLSCSLLHVGKIINGCGTYLSFKSCPSGHGKKLHLANFCRNRMCILCSWRRSLVIYHQVLAIVHRAKEIYKTDVPLMLTLTVPNCQKEDLKETVSSMSEGFRRLSERKQVKKSVRGWFRALEVTYNEASGTFHPHYHVLLMVPANYFQKKYDLYIDRDDWLKYWQEAMRDESISQVDIRKIKKKGNKNQSVESLVGEVAKYATKPGSYISRDGKKYKANRDAVENLYLGLKGKRLYGYGGIFKEVRKELKQEDVENADLVHIDGTDASPCGCKVCGSALLEELYTWRPGLSNYIFTPA